MVAKSVHVVKLDLDLAFVHQVGHGVNSVGKAWLIKANIYVSYAQRHCIGAFSVGALQVCGSLQVDNTSLLLYKDLTLKRFVEKSSVTAPRPAVDRQFV